jgi:hypothetical protein
MCIAVQKTERSLPVDGQVSRGAICEVSSQRWYTLTPIVRVILLIYMILNPQPSRNFYL